MVGSHSVPDCTLVGTSADLVGLACPIGRGRVVVGRGLEAVLRLDGDGVSRFHARLERSEGGALVVSDLGSSNGTFLNGRRVSRPEALHDGDRVRFGPMSAFVVRYGRNTGPETLEIVEPAPTQAAVDVLAKRNQARMLLAQRDFEEASALFDQVLDVLDAPDNRGLAAAEDIGEVLTGLARCYVGLGAHARAIPLCERAAQMLMGSSAGDKPVVRARFVLGQALILDEPDEARRIVREAAESLHSGDALRRELETWLAVAGSAERD